MLLNCEGVMDQSNNDGHKNKFKLTIKNFAKVPVSKPTNDFVDLSSIKRELGFD